MPFVKDDHSYTRGPGAIAALDAASPKRRVAMARAERALRLREALTQGAISRGSDDDRPSGPTAPTTPRPPRPPRPTRPPGGRPVPPRSPLGVRAGFRGPVVEQIKLPGTVITPEAGGGRPAQGATGSQAPVAVSSQTPVPASIVLPTSSPSKPVTIVAAPGIAPIPQVKAQAMASRVMPWDADDQEGVLEPTPAPASPKTSSKLPLYAGIGLLVYLLARK